MEANFSPKCFDPALILKRAVKTRAVVLGAGVEGKDGRTKNNLLLSQRR